jgi:hypothetical protein
MEITRRADGDHAMKMDTIKATAESAEGTLFSWGRLVRSLGSRGADPRSRLHRNLTQRLGGTVMNGLGCRRRIGCGGWSSARPSRAPVDGNLRIGDGPCPASPSGNIGREDGRVEERDHSGLPARTKQADALIAGAYLAGTKRGGSAGRSRPCSAAPWQGYGQSGLA